MNPVKKFNPEIEIEFEKEQTHQGMEPLLADSGVCWSNASDPYSTMMG